MFINEMKNIWRVRPQKETTKGEHIYNCGIVWGAGIELEGQCVFTHITEKRLCASKSCCTVQPKPNPAKVKDNRIPWIEIVGESGDSSSLFSLPVQLRMPNISQHVGMVEIWWYALYVTMCCKLPCVVS